MIMIKYDKDLVIKHNKNDNDDDENLNRINKAIVISQRVSSTIRSSAKSIKIINEYKGNDKLKNLRSLYKDSIN